MKIRWSSLALCALLAACLLFSAACAGERPAPSAAPSSAAPAATPSAALESPTPTPEATPSPEAVIPSAVPSAAPTPEVSDAPTCTVSISCATLLDHLDELDESTAALVPADGRLLAPTEVAFTEGETAFDLLKRLCRDEGIHLDFSLGTSAYVEGIGNLYEFDCGDLSGWIFAVNGVSPNSACSDYVLQDGDEVGWHYTCDMGNDLPDVTRG